MSCKCCCVLLIVFVRGLEVFEGEFEAHFEFGEALGKRFADKVRQRVNGLPNETSIPLAWKERHEKRFPNYIAELRGIASGSQVAYEKILALNFDEELAILSLTEEHCSDGVLPKLGVLVHNEDGAESDKNATFLVNVRIGKSRFYAYTYAGELCSGAFAWTPILAYTLNYVQPSILNPESGYGRSFVSRAILDAESLSEAISLATKTPMIAGHNYQIIHIAHTYSFFNIETAASISHITNLNEHAFFFHANEYDSLNVTQTVSESSLHRTVRAVAQVGPHIENKTDLLQLLSDTDDIDGSGSLPLFRSTTLATVCFDLPNNLVSIFENGPASTTDPIFSTNLFFSTEISSSSSSSS